MSKPVDTTGLEEYCRTQVEKDRVAAVQKHNGIRPAARAIGVTFQAVQQTIRAVKMRAAVKGHAPAHDMTRTVPEPFVVKGVSTYYGKEGTPKGQWVKSSLALDQAQAILRMTAAELAEPLRGSYKYTPSRANHPTNIDLMTVYAVGDAHFGMLAWAPESGEDFDLKLAEHRNTKALDFLADVVPDAGLAWLLIVGDLCHTDNAKGITEGAGNVLDTDSRYSQMVRSALRAVKTMIERLRLKHDKVFVSLIPGNHDALAALNISMMLAERYHGDPKVEIDLSPAAMRVREFGTVLVASDHGHAMKPQALVNHVARRYSEAWGRTIYREAIRGHVHSEHSTEIGGMLVRHVRAMPPPDAWHEQHGFGSVQAMVATTYDRRFGRFCEHTVTASRILST